MRPAILAGAMKLPVEVVNCKTVEKETTYTYQPMGEDEEVTVLAHYYDGDYLCVPRQYGLSLCTRLHLAWEDHTSSGQDANFPNIPTPRGYQEEPLTQIVDTFDSYYDFLFRAHTGWGKTIGSLIVAARLGRTTLILVDQENLRDQWLEVLLNPGLFGFSKDDIGIVQGKKCTYRGKAVTIAMVQTLSQKEFPQEFYDAFGTVIADEVHVMGAPTFSQVLLMFSAMYRLGVSATPKRRDGLQKAIEHNLGLVRVAADKEHAESSVYIIYHDTLYSWYANISPKIGRILTEVSDDGFRNLKMAEAVVWLYETGRDVLVLGDRIEQLDDMACLVRYMGVPDEEVGLYTGEAPKWLLDKDPRPSKRPKGYVRGTEYTPLKLQRVRKKIPKPQLKAVKTTAKIIFATYGMFSKGVDEPRLAGGVDATPRGTSEQQQGRIQREVAGKQMPIWVTIVDRQNYRLLHSFINRAKEYVKNNSRLYEWGEDGGLKECDPKKLFAQMRARVEELKAHRIETNADGQNTLVMEKSAKDKKQSHANDMREWAARHSRVPEKSRSVASADKSPSKVRPGRSLSRRSVSPRRRKR